MNRNRAYQALALDKPCFIVAEYIANCSERKIFIKMRRTKNVL